MQTKKLKKLLELYQFARDKKRISTKINLFNIETKRCDSTVVWLHFACIYKFSKSKHFMIMLTKDEPEKK